MQEHITAAHNLIKKLNAPPMSHSVWVKTDVNPETKQFVYSLCVSIRPNWKTRIKVPDAQDGIPVVQLPWPKGA